MRGAVAKRIRRMAEADSIGKPARRLLRGRQGNAINDIDSTRGRYRFLKRIYLGARR